MTFALEQSATYSWPVNFEYATDGGKFRRVSFEIIFNRLDQDRIEQILVSQQDMQRAVESGAPDLLDKLAQGRAHAVEVMSGWSGIKATEGGDDLEFSKANVAKFVKVPGMANAVLTAFGESLKLAKQGN